MDGDSPIEHLVAPESAGERIDRLLAAVCTDLSRSRIKGLIENGSVQVDGRTIADASYRVKQGERLHVSLPPPEPLDLKPVRMDLIIAYEDEDLIVIDKPAGLTVHPGAGNSEHTLVNALLAHCGDRLSGIGGVQRPGIVHRIDKDTSGLIVVAKSDRAHQGLAEQFADHSVERLYTAIVFGVPEPREGRIESDIGRHKTDRKRMAVLGDGRGKHAVTNYRLIRQFGLYAAEMECSLDTGRTHQIRVHMAHIGHPLIGDPVYGRVSKTRMTAFPPSVRAAVAGFTRQALHARTLGFVHPVTGKFLKFEAELPSDMMKLLAGLSGS